MGPVSGLLAHVLEHTDPRPDLALSRVSFDILGVIAAGEFSVRAEVVRPGRTVRLVVAELIVAGRVAVRATAWQLLRHDTASHAGTTETALPTRDTALPFDAAALWPGGLIRSVEFARIGAATPGRGRMWLRSKVDLLAGVPVSDTAALFAVIDTANGVAVRSDPADVLFPNVDLTVHLFRAPVGPWLGLDTAVSYGADGLGLTGSVLHDETGPFGRAAQTLTVRPRLQPAGPQV